MRPKPLPAYRCCPACAQRRNGRITPTCPVCQGAGIIALGRKAAAFDTDTALESIEIALETAATQHLATHPTGEALHTGPAILTSTMRRMTDHGLTAEPTVETTITVITARHRAGTLTTQHLETIAQHLSAEARKPQTTPTKTAQNRISPPPAANHSPRRNPQTT